ncbi:hypothetical protein ACFQER_14535 [Halomicroarcula sp. GCM10025894]|uniref:DUF7305 domain-containing protein n=1 Tax=Halomicroarcula sp. GCM10025894 TaxID=3252673 RepID=UPI00361B36D1
MTLALVTPLENTKVTSATASLSASGTFKINGAAGNLCGPDIYTNSYNSDGTDEGYCEQQSNGDTSEKGDLVYGGDVDISGGSGGGSGGDILGDVTSGGKVYVGNGGGSPDISGNISHTDGCDNCEGNTKIKGDVDQISGIDKAPAINGIIQTQVNETEQNNDNDDDGVPITDETVSYTSDTAELPAGSYYLQDITVGNKDTLTLDTTGGDIYLGVQENVALESNATIEVVGDGTASVYVLGDGGNENQLSMDSNSNITNAGDDAPQFRMFGQEDFSAQIGDGGGGAKASRSTSASSSRPQGPVGPALSRSTKGPSTAGYSLARRQSPKGTVGASTTTGHSGPSRC